MLHKRLGILRLKVFSEYNTARTISQMNEAEYGSQNFNWEIIIIILWYTTGLWAM